jgi:histidyl-tRNA synthetase
MQPFRGTYDQLPQLMRWHRYIIDKIRVVAATYGFEEMATPVFEYATVFNHTLGDTSDIVTKEMFSFPDRHGDLLALRPEGTAGIMRAVLSNKLAQQTPLRFFYTGPMFRYERPQKGRTRQFHQAGVEFIGEANPLADVEVIALGWQALKALGLEESLSLEINTLGDKESRDAYRIALVAYFEKHKVSLSADSQERLLKNPLRILDSKALEDQEIKKGAPQMNDYLTPSAKEFFDKVLGGLQELKIPYTLNPHLVRGLDYYCHTAFEITSSGLGAQNTLLAGGRYDGLSTQMGGPSLPSVGWATGIERLELVIPEIPAGTRPVSLVPLGEDAEKIALPLAFSLRNQGVSLDMAYEGGLKSRLKKANKINARYALIFGSDDLARNQILIKDLDLGTQIAINISKVSEHLKNIL